LVLCRFADGRIVSLELVITLREAAPSVLSSHPPPSCTGGVGRSVRCGRQAPPGRPHHVRQRCLLYCQAAPFRGRGEKCLQLQVSVTRPWCGPGGYIQVGMRGCESSGDPRAVRSVPPFLRTPVWKLFAIQAPSFGGEIAIRLGDGELITTFPLWDVVCCVWCVLCPEDRRVVVGVLSPPTLAPCRLAGVWFTLTRDQGPWWSPGTRTGGVEG